MPFTPGRSVRQTRQHQVDDVFRHRMIAPGDEDLVAENPVAVAVTLRPRTHHREVRTGLRFGQVHGAGPRTGNHVGQVHRFERVTAVHHDRIDGPLGEQRAQAEREVCRLDHLLHRGGKHQGQSLATVFARKRQAVPAAIDILPVGFLEALGLHHCAILDPRALLITAAVERCDSSLRELCGAFQDRPHQVRCSLFQTRQRRDLRHPRMLLEHECDIRYRCLVFTHFFSSLKDPDAPLRWSRTPTDHHRIPCNPHRDRCRATHSNPLPRIHMRGA